MTNLLVVILYLQDWRPDNDPETPFVDKQYLVKMLLNIDFDMEMVVMKHLCCGG